MTAPENSNQQREFRCEYCDGLIRVPIHLPPTTAPCPHCGKDITSPGESKQSIEFPVAPAIDDSRDPIGSTEDIQSSDSGNDPETDEWQETPAGESKPSMALTIAVVMVVLILAAAGVFFMVSQVKARQDRDQPGPDSSVQADDESNFIRTGWKKDAYDALEGFLSGKSVEQKLPYILHPEKLEPIVREFYGDDAIDDQDTPSEAFSVYNLPEQDRINGMFMLVFDQPPQLDMKNFFRPVATLEVQYGLEEADLLLSSMAQFANFSMEPVRVHAIFKMTAAGLKLDWELYRQTKYRTLRHFIDDRKIGSSEVFRVFINEDVPERGNITGDSRTYRVMDPANSDDIARIAVPIDSKIANELAGLNWVGIQGAPQIARTATIELEWLAGKYEPTLAIKRFICWEYLGLGGQEKIDLERDPRLPEE